MRYILIFVLLGSISCSEHRGNMPAGIQFPATYAGMVPCADCVGIKYELTLEVNKTFTEKMVYAGKSDEVLHQSGKWFMLNDSVLALQKDQEGMRYFMAEGGNLIMLDRQAKRITGNTAGLYVLRPGHLGGLKAPESLISSKESGLADFQASGNEPFWNLEIDFARGIWFREMGQMEVKGNTAAMQKDEHPGTIRYESETASGILDVSLTSTSCTDNMSGAAYPVTVEVSFDGKTYIGCGDYNNDRARTNGSWQLQSMEGWDGDATGLQRGKPMLLIDIATGGISGHTSCNSFSGSCTITDEIITFAENMAMTKMACPGTLEQLMVQQLQGDYTYVMRDRQLELLRDGLVVMTFVRYQ
ncbi:MAG: hypothetical protein ABR95_05205 [Sphingobacteriales bacterium BACL12 MAG-120813-bin55]|jgi:uncharacterized membrane protein|nr:MAG: hypothetical protein ABR94_11675 [Sphingobacteriales bacterium BACL12 MAG-120802-bin5]KRP13872.1 MAG: hypothetical protein ABR95_05205 [Sphingobacteriales bacterium BACL12 MAG-120813-bin55]